MSKRPVPKDLNNNPIPHSKRFGYSTPSIANRGLRSHTVSGLLVLTFIGFSKSALGTKVYSYLDREYGDYNMSLWGTFIVTTVFYWLWSGVFAICDLTERPRWLFKYKTQPFIRVSGKEYLKIALIALRNQVLVALPLIVLDMMVHPPRAVAPEKLPSAAQMFATVLFDMFCTEAGFYYIHRTFHQKPLYALFHKQHHEFTAPVGLASTYCTVTEHVFSNLLPNVIGMILVEHHWAQATFTLMFLEFGTICSHSGYNIPYMQSNLQHDFHHFAFDENFGPVGYFDWLHQTNKKFTRTMAEATSRTDGDEERARQLVLQKLAQDEIDSKKQK